MRGRPIFLRQSIDSDFRGVQLARRSTRESFLPPTILSGRGEITLFTLFPGCHPHVGDLERLSGSSPETSKLSVFHGQSFSQTHTDADKDKMEGPNGQPHRIPPPLRSLREP